MKAIVFAATMALAAFHPVSARAAPVECIGMVVQVDKAAPGEPVTFILERSGRICVVPWEGSGHNPVRPCETGGICHIVANAGRGTINKTVWVDNLYAVDAVASPRR